MGRIVLYFSATIPAVTVVNSDNPATARTPDVILLKLGFSEIFGPSRVIF